LLYHFTLLPAVMTAVYTAFLFAQAKARDLWQSPLLPAHLLVQAVMAGAGATTLMCSLVGDNSETFLVSNLVLGASLLVHLGLILGGEVMIEHSSKAKERAVRLMTCGPYSHVFWGLGMVAGGLIPLALIVWGLAFGLGVYGPIAAGLSLIGLLAYEHCFVLAGQSIRLS
ncbi:MAG TPA: NrfD/PsrC family molybdoenzyme membrane anchor subunit, partial [Candidatus Obscuribacterales bacterium]